MDMGAVVYERSSSSPEVELARVARTRRVDPSVWALRVIWLILPVTAGPAGADALDAWSRAPRLLASVLLWVAWAAVLVAVLAPRPIGLTAARVVAPAFAALAIACAWSASTGATVAAIVTTVLATLLVCSPPFARASAEGVAYGDEARFPLKTPPALLAGPLPLVVAIVAAGPVTGPLLLADGRIVAGVIATVVGLPLAFVLTRSLHRLSSRWCVLVPAGVTLVDGMTLADAVLFPREHVERLESAPLHPPDGALDLRLGASVRSLALRLSDGAQLLTATRGWRPGSKVTTSLILFAPVQADVLRAEMARRERQRNRR